MYAIYYHPCLTCITASDVNTCGDTAGFVVTVTTNKLLIPPFQYKCIMYTTSFGKHKQVNNKYKHVRCIPHGLLCAT